MASAYVLCPLNPFFILIYKGSGLRSEKEKDGEFRCNRIVKCSRMIKGDRTVKVNIQTGEVYAKLLFKYSKSMAESSSIIRMDCT